MRVFLTALVLCAALASCNTRVAVEPKHNPANGMCVESSNWKSPTALHDNMEALSKRIAENPDLVKRHLDQAVAIIMCSERAKVR